MKKIILSLIVLCIVSTVIAQNTRSLKKVIELQMPKTAEDELCGKRGAGVCWNPVTQKYYASFAGNAGFPLAVFDFKGKRLTADTVTTQIDTRGLWYNPKTKKISGNAYSDYGWFSYKLNAKGFPAAVDIILSGENQPEENSVGTYIPLKDKVAFLNGPNVSLYDVKDGSISESVIIHWGHTKADGEEEDEFMELPEGYNYTSLVYSGTKGAELGFLNVDANVIELYDISSGFLTKKLELPLMTVSEESFNFAYTNGIYWLFNISDRKWEGYK
ncbi:MAG: hypothetical protein WCI49_01155 [Ferruginibacter sp.]